MNADNKIIKDFFLLKGLIPAEIQEFLHFLKKKQHGFADKPVHLFHEKVFDEVNCTECANCCKNISPAVKDKDIERLSKNLKIKPLKLIEKYFILDDDGDYVFTKTPCPFLSLDNLCSVYEVRPKACRQYPHTDRRKFLQILPLTEKNIKICPAVLEIIKCLRKFFKTNAKGL